MGSKGLVEVLLENTCGLLLRELGTFHLLGRVRFFGTAAHSWPECPGQLWQRHSPCPLRLIAGSKVPILEAVSTKSLSGTGVMGSHWLVGRCFDLRSVELAEHLSVSASANKELFEPHEFLGLRGAVCIKRAVRAGGMSHMPCSSADTSASD